MFRHVSKNTAYKISSQNSCDKSVFISLNRSKIAAKTIPVDNSFEPRTVLIFVVFLSMRTKQAKREKKKTLNI